MTSTDSLPDNDSTRLEPAITVIIVTWNRKLDLLEMLSSLDKQTFRDFEVVVVDQGSKDGTSDAVREQFPAARLVTLPENCGVCVGKNVGVSYARGEIVFFLDDDAIVSETALEIVWNEFMNQNDIGIVSGKVADYYTGEIQRNYWVYPDYQIPRSEQRFEAAVFSAGIHAVRRRVFDVVGLYDDFLIFGPEEFGLSIRCFAAGFRIVYNPNIVLRHKGRYRMGWDSERWLLFVCGRLLIVLRYYPFPGALTVLFEYVVGYFFQAIRNRYLGAYIRALAGVVRRLPIVLARHHPLDRKSFKAYRELENSQRGPFLYRLRHELLRSRR